MPMATKFRAAGHMDRYGDFLPLIGRRAGGSDIIVEHRNETFALWWCGTEVDSALTAVAVNR